MEDKMFELLTKMYSEFSKRFEILENGQKNLENGQKNLENGQKNLENRQKNLENGQKNLEDRQKNLENGQKNLEIRLLKMETMLENDIKPDIKAVYQVQADIVARLDRHELRLKNIEEKVDVLSAKSLRHSYEIGAIKRQKKAK